MNDERTVYLIGGEDDEQATFTIDDVSDDCHLRCNYRGKMIERVASDYFQALCDVRAGMAEDGLIPFCYGASLKVFPSGMARDMGQGLKAYRLTMGQPARMSDLIDIFADGPDVIPASVSAQEQFFNEWLASLRS